MKGHAMKHLSPLTKSPKPADSVFSLMIQTKIELMEDNTFLKDIF